jgi:mono/diheme cytochrome c family protein
MPPFAQTLSNEEIAAVVTYIRQSWGNRAAAVSPADVDKYRNVPLE